MKRNKDKCRTQVAPGLTTLAAAWVLASAGGAAVAEPVPAEPHAVSGTSAAPPSPTAVESTKRQLHTEKYWTSHPQAWPCNSLCLGHFAYNKADLAYLLRLPRQKDASLQLAAQLVAAKLNLASGLRSPEAEHWIWQADAYLGTQDFLPLAEPVNPTGALGRQLLDLAAKLESFNAGKLTEKP